jgi:hypothetical protein
MYKIQHATSEVFMAVSMKNVIFWDIISIINLKRISELGTLAVANNCRNTDSMRKEAIEFDTRENGKVGGRGIQRAFKQVHFLFHTVSVSS